MKSSKTATERIFENVIFLADVFGDRPEKDLPPLPVLEMARCFELAPSPVAHAGLRRKQDWPLWRSDSDAA